MPSTNCSVLGCKSKERKHVFPQNDDDFNMWLQRCNNDKLFHLEKSVVRG
ncbi:THAP domain-containing protein 6-like, partial [Aphis craccivora]